MSGIRIGPVFPQPVSGGRTAAPQAAGKTGSSFDELLTRELGGDTGVSFSRHAATRLSERGIELSGEDLQRLGGAVNEASQKGVQDSLVVMDRLAFIVSVPDRTVVTAMPVNEAGATVFTNIDGAVIA